MAEAVHDVILWCDGFRAGLAGRVIGLLPGLRVVSLGGPSRGTIADLADSLGVKVEDDLRKMLIDHPARFLFLTTGEGVGATELKAAKEAGVALVTLDPIGDPAATFVPSWRATPAWLGAAEPLQAVGKARSVHLTSMGPRSTGTLYARLHESLDMLTHLLGVPQSIDAALTAGPIEPPEEPQALTGDVTAHLRFSGHGSAVLHVSDRVSSWSRRLVILAEQGRFEMDDMGYTLTDGAGKVLDCLMGTTDPPDPADLIARQWQRIVDGFTTPRPADPRAVESACRATLLSCRTGQLESPGKLLTLKGL